MSHATIQMACWLMAISFVPRGSASVIYVRAGAAGANNGTSWADAYTDLQTALLSSQAGDEIRVAQGTYKPAIPGGDRAVSFALRSGIALRGGFAGVGADPDARDPAVYVTILSGDINEPNADDSYHVVTATDVDATAVLDGFTITGGRAEGAVGGGVRLVNASMQIRACRIVENLAGAGGGISVTEQSNVTISHCDISSNECYSTQSAGAGVYCERSIATLMDSTISDNIVTGGFGTDFPGFGGGICCIRSGAVLIMHNCVVDGNVAPPSGYRISAPSAPPGGSGGGVAVIDDALAVIVNCTFRRNAGGEGGTGFIGSGGGSGGAISVEYGASAQIHGCVFHDNVGGPGGIGGFNGPCAGGNGGAVRIVRLELPRFQQHAGGK